LNLDGYEEGKKSMRKVICLTALSLILAMMPGCGERSVPLQQYQRDNFVMDTLVHIQVYCPDGQIGQLALGAAFDEFSRIADLSDKFAATNLSDPEISDVYRVNKNAGIKPVQVSDDTLVMLEKSLEYARLSDGAFDITVGPLMELWGFGQGQYRLPAVNEVQSTLALVDYQQVVLDKQARTVFLPVKGMEIDLGGIAKGYATDRAAQKLRQLGITSALINAGGNVLAIGSKPDGSAWSTGIQDPRDKTKLIAVIKVKDRAVVSSGDYERCFFADGIRYHHILDPSTGQPARQLMAATIVAPGATEADLLSTTLFVLGTGPGMEMANKLTDVQVVFIDEQKNISISPSLEQQIDFMAEGGYVHKMTGKD